MYAPLLALACVLAGTAPVRAADTVAAEPDAAQRVTQLHRTPPAHDPAAAFAKRLDLDAQQQAQVKRLLAIRQAQIRNVWNDPSIAADDRVGAVKAINEKTEAQIRALLTEEQRKRYFQPRPSGSPATDPKPSVEEWLNVTRPRKDSSPAPAPDPTPR